MTEILDLLRSSVFEGFAVIIGIWVGWLLLLTTRRHRQERHIRGRHPHEVDVRPFERHEFDDRPFDGGGDGCNDGS